MRTRVGSVRVNRAHIGHIGHSEVSGESSSVPFVTSYLYVAFP